MEVVDALLPDLIIANKEENVKDQVEELRKKYPVWVSDVITLQDATGMIQSLGQITNTAEKANTLVNQIEYNFSSLYNFISIDRSHGIIKTAYLIWNDPYMAAGGDTFINTMLQQCGFKNAYIDFPRYPMITVEELANYNCELLLLSSEPYPFGEKHKKEIQKHLPMTKVILVDGEFFSWYGSRLLSAPGYFRDLLQRIR